MTERSRQSFLRSSSSSRTTVLLSNSSVLLVSGCPFRHFSSGSLSKLARFWFSQSCTTRSASLSASKRLWQDWTMVARYARWHPFCLVLIRHEETKVTFDRSHQRNIRFETLVLIHVNMVGYCFVEAREEVSTHPLAISVKTK